MNRQEFQGATDRLGSIALAQVVNQLPGLCPASIQWNLMRIFGIYISADDVEKEAAAVPKETCAVCWSHEQHDESSHDYSNKRTMADLLLNLEASIRAGEV